MFFIKKRLHSPLIQRVNALKGSKSVSYKKKRLYISFSLKNKSCVLLKLKTGLSSLFGLPDE